MDVNDAVRDVLALVHVEAVVQNVSLVEELAEGLPRVSADKIQIEQVLLNLVLNAERATAGMSPGERKILVSTTKDVSGGVVVAVRDTGPGIVKDKLDRVFEPFYTTKFEGLGMGLAISRSIVTAHGGRIWAENAPEGGAKVSFTLPKAE